jgi:hypothetical protein
MRKSVAAGVVASSLFVCATAVAHHSFAAFDRSRQTEITGVIKVWKWTNPHTWLLVSVNQGGNVVEYAFEGFTPTQLPKYGITRNKYKVGDKVVVKYFPRRDNGNGGQFVGLSFATDGTSK